MVPCSRSRIRARQSDNGEQGNVVDNFGSAEPGLSRFGLNARANSDPPVAVRCCGSLNEIVDLAQGDLLDIPVPVRPASCGWRQHSVESPATASQDVALKSGGMSSAKV